MSVADTSLLLEDTLRECIGQCPAIGFVVCGDTSNSRNQGTVTAFQRKNGKVWALNEGYGRGRAPRKHWDCGEKDLVDVLTETIKRLMVIDQEGTTMTWQAWDYEYPPYDKQENHPHKSFIVSVFSGKRGVVARMVKIPNFK